MTTQFEAKEFLIFSFLTSAQQQNHSSYLLTSSLTYMKPHSTGVTLYYCYNLNPGASRMAVNFNSTFYAATVRGGSNIGGLFLAYHAHISKAIPTSPLVHMWQKGGS